MSRATEIAEQEAAEAEAATPEPEPEQPTPEPEPEPEPQPEGLNEAQADAVFKSLEREHDRHAREFDKRNGAAVGLVACPCCNNGTSPVAGYIFPELPEPAQSQRREAVNEALGGHGAVAFRDDAERERCETCAGLGMLRTGSLVPNQDVLPCRACNGQGWRQKLAPVQVPPQVLAGPQAGNGGGVDTFTATTADPWGRPLGHPHYNIPPAQVAG